MLVRVPSLLALLAVACDGGDSQAQGTPPPTATVPASARASRTAPPVSTPPPTTVPRQEVVEVVRALPHDPQAFTQGLIVQGARFLESTGLNGRSSLREVDIATGRVLRRVEVDPAYFAEGLTRFGDKLYQLTWQSGVGLVYDAERLIRLGEWRYAGEGWGLTHDDHALYMSDGTATIRVLDPATLETIRTFAVHDRGRPITRLNELEWVEGELLANVWMTDRIVVINPSTGDVTAWIDLRGLLSPEDRSPETDVLNGIAYDAANAKLYVTGKLWPKVFEVRRVAAP